MIAASSETHRVYLIPGFFGFVHLGETTYFGHVERALDDLLHRAPGRWFVDAVDTSPSGSLRRRARLLLDQIAATSNPGDHLHLVGHSTGGLDARLLVSPGVELGEGRDAEPVARQVRSVVGISTPHRGTPSASFFAATQGKLVLRLLSAFTVVALRRGRVPLAAVRRLTGTLRGRDLSEDAYDAAVDAVTSTLAPDLRDGLRAFLEEVRADQTLLTQLTPDTMDALSVATRPRPGVRYGSVVTVGRRPGIASALSIGLSPYHHATHLAYAATHRLAGAFRADEVDPEVAAALAAGAGHEVRPSDNDGMVPSLSQLHGELLRVVRADHLDAIGHFHEPAHDPPHHDWMASGSGFRRAQFDALWADVALFLARPPAPT